MGKKKILIVDDEKTFCWMVKINLEKTGEYEVKTESKSRMALSAAREFKPDLIILDVVMPDMYGTEICKKISQEKDLKDIPIVFLTAIVTEAEAEFQEGIIEGRPTLAKPITTEKLITHIERMLE
ncbi:MAG: response regulator [Desulfobacula sp.]|uniref:response regulator n=1 Tax=Desulfobacula sp. TaxID=2593537 RepID=UPI001DFC00E6|nr:response regulator [Desulfobacula sp.]MBT3485729.1 response regulator [Desulfobacula sp.]MBT3805150.1 response regulator [Desulfobacula sp.]MBT4025545.1 response regulator [Desulfobacula sp.]MBT4198944.1 response regulator [Desulfobacula sp.]